MNKPILAIMYDFDKTLSTTDMQNYAFIPALGLTPDEFWGKTGEFSARSGCERILSYMYMMIEEAKEKGINLTRDFLKSCGKNIEYYPGVRTWFKRINEYGLEHGICVEHYLVSSGTIEIVEGCDIYPEFTQAYGCEYYYDSEGHPVWPKLAINYTQKTQFFFRIAKGAISTTDDKTVNEKTSVLRVPYRNIVYMGDGMTDIACMTLVKKNGGRSIALYSNESDEAKVKQIFDDGRVSFYCKANYLKNSKLESYLKLIIDSIAVSEKIEHEQSLLANE